MSSQRGNTKKRGPPKHPNRTAFKNNLHDTSKRAKQINDVETGGVCKRCKEIVDWKIKYKKYKPLTQPKKCTRCLERTVKQAYYIICTPCASKLHVCAKCGADREIVLEAQLPEAEQAMKDADLQFELGQLSERQRRTFFRLQEQGKLGAGAMLDEMGQSCSKLESSDTEHSECSEAEDNSTKQEELEDRLQELELNCNNNSDSNLKPERPRHFPDESVPLT